LKSATADRLFEEAFGIPEVSHTETGGDFELARELSGRLRSARKRVPEEFFVYSMGDPWAVNVIEHPSLVKFQSRDRLLDLLELLYRDVVSTPIGPRDAKVIGYAQGNGQQRFKAAVNPVLARVTPPLEMDESGEIVNTLEEPFRRLVEQPLRDEAPKREVGDRVEAAIKHFRRRGATADNRRAAVKELVDVLEYLRPDAEEHLMSEDEGALFQLANNFAIRHNKRETRRDFDEPAFLAWAFYVYLATIRLMLELRGRRR
jgi:hypothetical protein